MHIPDFLEEYRTQINKLLVDWAFREIHFSGPTYQVQLVHKETNEEVWVFVQLDSHHEVKDTFCSCEISSQKGSCVHMLGALQRIYYNSSLPLHQIFEKSFWKTFFLMLMKKWGDKPSFSAKQGLYELGQKGIPDNFVLQVKPAMREKIVQILEGGVHEHEENSIKFSNLTEEELERWQRGYPNENLRFELSCWGDLAKWMMVKYQFTNAYHMHFEYDALQIPYKLNVETVDVKWEASLDRQYLEEIIPSLSTVNSPLCVVAPEAMGVQKIHYDMQKKTLFIDKTAYFKEKTVSNLSNQSMMIGPWNYIFQKGFYWKGDQDQVQEVIQGVHAITKFLDRFPELMIEMLQGLKFYTEVHSPQYTIFFDIYSTLHVEAFLFCPGDLALPHAWVLGWWAFIPEKGFFRIESLKFKVACFLVNKEDMDPFLRQNRAWLNHFPAFKVHLNPLEEKIGFQVDEEGHLLFTRTVEKGVLDSYQKRDLGNWAWVEDQGFYLKELNQKQELGIYSGQRISKDHVASFIRQHTDVLHGISCFFMTDSPVELMGLQIRMIRDKTIAITPQYAWHDPEDENKALFFEEYIHIEGKGFFRLPVSLRPLAYMRPISRDDVDHWNQFFQETLPKLRQEFSCDIDIYLLVPTHLVVVMEPDSVETIDESELISGNSHHWQMRLYYRSEIGVVSASLLALALKKAERFCPTPAGLLDLADDRFKWIRYLRKAKDKDKKDYFELTTLDLFKVHAFETVEVVGEEKRSSARTTLLQLMDMKPTSSPSIEELVSELRPYQEKGLEWLWFLRSNGLSGLLCDDMGLGKTHQAMGLMAAIRTQRRSLGLSSQFLIICPTSVVYHWQDKLTHFLPAVRVQEYWGVQRSLDLAGHNFDVLLTTYGVWRNDWKILKDIFFEAAFFDELQVAKNHISRIHQTLHKAHARTKIGLTGTPIENQMRELKALFDLILPGYMPKDLEYKELFLNMREGELSGAQLLSRFVKPFVLRRKKHDVLKDLPEKTEEMRTTELLGEQKRLYHQVATQQALPLIQQIRDEKEPIPYLHIFALIASLKQICNHPALFLKDVSNFEQYESGKWESFLEILEEALESNQKVVVFSQYLNMLDIMKMHLDKHHIAYAEIRGVTKNRKAELERFQNDPGCTVFLASLQAAGLGIDLTAASCVIHYDRWWNPARENQATDRVHRMGQKRGVQVFKFITWGTIEEKIEEILKRKERLLEDVICSDDHRWIKRLDRGEILELLRFVTH